MSDVQTSKVDCPRCGGYVVIPALRPDERGYVAEELRKSDSKIEWIKQLRAWTGFDIADAKRFVNHFGITKGVCTWCGKELPAHSDAAESVICPHCRSLNLDW